MTERSRLETEIAARLTRLSDADMQRVAEDYARVRYPERFPRFDFRAFSLEGKSRSGWPDARIDAGGQVDGVEATGAKDKGAVKQHLEDYLAKALKHKPRLRGFIHVSGHPEVQLTAAEIADLRRAFIDQAGIDPDRLDLVFGGGLVHVLALPEFARTRIELLGLSDAPTHFKLVRAKRGPDESRLNSTFVPSEEDYAARHVHRPAIADRILDRLSRDGCALVRGVGASGKSVLAWLLALEFAERRCPAYSLDIADYEDGNPGIASAFVEDLHRFGHPQALFVIDNCHLDERLAKEVVLAWRDLPPSQQPQLLLLGRELATSRGSLIDGLGIDPLIHKALQPELLGVYKRLAWRNSGTEPPQPPPDVLDDWMSTFGGNPRSQDSTADLIAFSAAVLRRMAALMNQVWTLTEDDAIEEIRAVYLGPDKLSPDESRNLMRLCVMEELEIGLSDQALADPRAGLDRCNRRYGLVFRQEAGGSGQHVRYRLAHSALAQLILRAAYEPVDRPAERKIVAFKHPFSGAAALGRLLAIDLLQEAGALASEILHKPEFLLNLGSLLYTHLTLLNVQRLGIPLTRHLGETLSSGILRKQFLEQALKTPLHFLVTFLGYAARTKEMHSVFAAITEDLALPKNRDPLTSQALKTPLHFLVTFLGYAARTKEMHSVFAAITEDLALPKNRDPLTSQALKTPLDHLATFLGYAARTKEMHSVFAAITEDLALPKNRDPLTSQALKTPLDHLATFLGYAARTKEMHSVFAAITEDLALPKNRDPLTSQALKTPLGDLATFLGYAARTKEMHSVFAAITEDLALPKNRDPLTSQALKTPLHFLVTFLGYAARTKEMHSVFAAITEDLALPKNRDPLTSQALKTPLDHLATFLGYAARTKEMHSVFAAITEDLALPKNRDPLTSQALKTPLDHLATFLGYAARTKEMHSVFAAITEDLALPASRRELARAIAQQPLSAVVSVLTSKFAGNLWNAVFAEIDTGEWDEARRGEDDPTIEAFVAFQRIAAQRARPELAEAPALRIVSRPEQEKWHRPTAGLHHLSHVLRCARKASSADIERFLDRIATPAWLDPLFALTQAGPLAGNIYALALRLEPDMRRWFQRDALRGRVVGLLSQSWTLDAKSCSDALALLGAAAAIGTATPIEYLEWPSAKDIAEAVELRAPDPERTTIGPLTAQLWRGLYEMARARRDPVIMPSDLANRVLDCWLVTQEGETGEALAPHVRDSNSEMIGWLQLCKAAGWALVPPEVSTKLVGHRS